MAERSRARPRDSPEFPARRRRRGRRQQPSRRRPQSATMAGRVSTAVWLWAALAAVSAQLDIKKVADQNPALHRLNDRVITTVFADAGSQNEIVCTYCLFQVVSSAFQMGNALVQREIKDALGSPAPQELSEALLQVTQSRKTLQGLFAGYYAKKALICPRQADRKRCQAANSVLKMFGKEKDFTNANTKTEINEDVSRATDGYIRDLFTSLRPDTELVFTAALLFRDEWPSRLTSLEGEFRSSPAARPQSVSMLTEEEELQVLDGSSGVLGVALPYRDPATSLYCFTSASESDDIRDLLYQQHYLDLSRAETRNTLVRLPEFNIASKQYSYVETMQLMGMREMFLGGLGPTDRLKVDQLVHKAVMQTDEDGTVAAGAAGIAFVPLSAKPTPFQVTFDHPFICSLVDNELVQPIFTAYIADPSSQ